MKLDEDKLDLWPKLNSPLWFWMLRGALHWLPAAPADIAVQVPLAGPMPPGKGPSDGTCVEDTCRKLQKKLQKSQSMV